MFKKSIIVIVSRTVRLICCRFEFYFECLLHAQPDRRVDLRIQGSAALGLLGNVGVDGGGSASI